MKSIQKVFQDVINSGESLKLEYQGNPRHIIPLVYGELKNGKEAVLCYKINGYDSDGPELSIRLYHSHKISKIEKTGTKMPFSKNIDYYLTKHFRTVYVKV